MTKNNKKNLPENQKDITPLDTLVEIMSKLRGKEGCPWDLQQTRESLIPFLIEETYEVVEAISNANPEEIKEELGDLLFQVIFHTQIAKERSEFDINDTINYVTEKIIRRHPHVFADIKVKDAKEVLKNWEQIKQEEKRGKQKKEEKSILSGLPRQMPALLKAHRLQEKVSRVGFDWDNLDQVFKKVDEELMEFKEAISKKGEMEIEEEFGDLLFSLVNVARYIHIDPELALNKTIDKFINRFHYIEENLTKQGKDLGKVSLEELDQLWEEGKKARR
ncbi:MAG: nucleoside triphosphate pyrophosphohydrolase [bacterium]